MRLAKAFAFAAALLVGVTASVNAALLEEHVTGGTLDLDWVAGFNTANTMYARTLDPADPAYANPSGDHTVAVAQNASPDSGGIIVTLANPDPTAGDYVWEGWIFTGGGETRRGLILRATPANDFKSMYQFVIQQGLFRISFRKLIDSAPTTLRDWFATSLPAQSIPRNTWHKMKVIAVGNEFRCFFDDFELTTTPIVDNAIAAGWVGCYNFRFDLGNVPVYFDDLVLSCPSELPVAFDVEPNTLNLRSLGPWVKGVIEPVPPALASDIEVASIRLNGSVSVDPGAPVELGDADGDGITDLSVRFLRSAVDLTVDVGDAVPVQVTGLLAGACFSGTDHIKVVRPRILAPVAGDVVAGGSVTQVRWEIPSGVSAPTVALLLSMDGGATWNIAARDVANLGACDLLLPMVASEQARLAVVQIESVDGTGDQVNGVLSISDPFIITTPLGVEDVPVGLALRGLANPSRGPLQVLFTLPATGAVHLAVYDVIGRLVSERALDGYGAGRHTLTLVDRASTGVYLVRLTHGNRSVTTRISVVR